MAKGFGSAGMWLALVIVAGLLSQFNHRAATEVPRQSSIVRESAAPIPQQPNPQIVTDWSLEPLSSAEAAAASSAYDAAADVPETTVFGEGSLHRVIATRLNVREQPGTTSSVISSLQQGSVVRAVAEADGWAMIALSEDRFGWVRTDFLTAADAATPLDAPLVASVSSANEPTLVRPPVETPTVGAYQALRAARVGTCDCPYDVKRNGAICGASSAYSKPGGKSPACYVGEQTLTKAPAYKPSCAENGTCFGDISTLTGKPKTVFVRGYTRKDGTYVRGHYRSK